MNNTNFASYADNNSSHAIGMILKIVHKTSKLYSNLFQWFSNKKMKTNAEKCYFICSSNKNANLTFENDQILKYICGKLLDVKIGSKFNFNTHVNDICKKARQKLNTLARITQYWDFDKRIII